MSQLHGSFFAQSRVWPMAVQSICVGLLAACGSLSAPPRVDGNHRQPVNSPEMIARFTQTQLTQSSQESLKTAPPETRSSPLRPPAKPPQPAATPAPKAITWHFPFNGTQLILTAAQRAEVSTALPLVEAIQIRGRTDSAFAGVKDKQIAYGRALAAKLILTELGASEERITLSFSGAGDHIAPNSTQQGRARNRRVELVFIYEKEKK